MNILRFIGAIAFAVAAFFILARLGLVGR